MMKMKQELIQLTLTQTPRIELPTQSTIRFMYMSYQLPSIRSISEKNTDSGSVLVGVYSFCENVSADSLIPIWMEQGVVEVK